MTLSKKFSTLLAGAVIALGLAACNGGADNQAASGGQPAAAGADTVAAIKEKGVIPHRRIRRQTAVRHVARMAKPRL